MSKKPSGLGKGLEALIPKAQGHAPTARIPIGLIKPNPAQPRRRFDQAALDELAASIREKGVLQPILVRPKAGGYELVAGERRFRAAQKAGLTEIPVHIKDLTEREALEIALVENLQRADLNPVEEALGYRGLVQMGRSQEEVAAAVGKARATVANALRLLQLPKEVLGALEDGRITPGHARALLMLPENRRQWGLSQVLSRDLTVRAAEQLGARLAGRPAKKSGAYPTIARELSRKLGLVVRLTGEKKGRLEIHYNSQEELDGLLQALGYDG